MALADELGGVVINADAMQVYADLRILTARPSDDDMARVPHRLFGHVDAAEAYSVGRWLADAERVLADVWSEGRVPILVGGTGLYFKALTQGLSAIPAIPEDIRIRLRAQAVAQTPAALHQRLAACDPDMAARLRPTDPQRILRALEVFEATGVSLREFHATRSAPLVSPMAAAFVSPSRLDLNRSIDHRLDRMVEGGALVEVGALASRVLDPALPAMRALGVAELAAALAGAMPLDAALARAKLSTRRYAKRQVTFARHQLTGFRWVLPEEGHNALLDLWRRPKC